MPRLRLPPLPPGAAYPTVFTRRHFPSAHTAHLRESTSRLLVASRTHADAFVRALDLRPGGVVVELYAGVGQVTRSLLAGGRDETTAKDWDGVRAESGDATVTLTEGSSRRTSISAYPPWTTFAPPDPAAAPDANPARPALVVATDPSHGLLVRGLGMPWAPPTKPDLYAVQPPAESTGRSEGTSIEPPLDVVASPLQPGLLMAPISPYPWSTVPRILSHPAVSPHLEKFSDAPGADATKRPWSAPPPNITVVAQMQESAMGEQMISQWIGCAAGDEHRRSWLWQWGRVRLGLLVGAGTFDRLIAAPGDKVHCKLSVMANALFHVSPLLPHSPTPVTAGKWVRTKRGSIAPSAYLPTPPTESTPTSTFDFWPAPYGAHEDAPLARPALLGVSLVPRLASPVLPEQKDVWDFVLRKCFVRDTATLADALPQLEFGAANLATHCEADGAKYRGDMVARTTRVRDMTVEQWARVVDVFDKWPFRPEHLVLDAFTSDVRAAGVD
ncbi:Mitochondrial transcription factor 1 [Cryptotrichosporon argae]